MHFAGRGCERKREVEALGLRVRPHGFDRFLDDRHEIDRQSLRIYKANLSILNERYNEYERRLLALFAEAIRILMQARPSQK